VRASYRRDPEGDRESAQVVLAQASFQPTLAPTGRAAARGPHRLAPQAGPRRAVNGADGVDRTQCLRIAAARSPEAAPDKFNNSATEEAIASAAEDSAGVVVVSVEAVVEVSAEAAVAVEADGGGKSI
jgi:hypothetical protein